MTSAYPAPSAALPPPVGGGGEEADDDDFDFEDDDDGTEEAELVAADDGVAILRNVRSRSDARARRCSACRVARALLPSSHVR